MLQRREFLLSTLGAALSVVGAEEPATRPRRGATAPYVSPRARAKAAYAAFVKAYWMEEKALFRRHKDRGKPLDFWYAAHAWDMLIDADKLFHTPQTKALVKRFYDGFCRQYPDWTKNEFNDDILWWTIACTNAYAHTREKRYLEQARTHFDWLVAHEVDDTLGGGMWWKNSKHGSKNACDNFPAVITACNLYQHTKEKKYKDAALALFRWSRKTFFDEATGTVWDNLSVEGKLTRWDFTYNTGTFIGSCLRLYRLTFDKKYLQDAFKAGHHMVRDLSRDGIVKPAGREGDGGAFHGIGFRYLSELAKRADGRPFRSYILKNAEAAWAHRRPSDDLVGHDFLRVPAETADVEGQIANSALTLILLAAQI